MTKTYCDICQQELDRPATDTSGGKNYITGEGGGAYFNVSASVKPQIAGAVSHLCEECKAIAIIGAVKMWIPEERMRKFFTEYYPQFTEHSSNPQ